MVRDYTRQMYEPMAKRAEALSAHKFARAKDLADWKQRVIEGWGKVAVVSVDLDSTALVTDLGATRQATAEVVLGDIAPDEVAVELLHGPVSGGEEMSNWEAVEKVRMELVGDGSGPGPTVWEGSFVCDTAGRHGFTVRVVPAHTDLVSFAETGCVSWAKSA
jgi:starch phosphorylase